MKVYGLTALATLLASSHAFSNDALINLKSRPSELGMDILPPKQDPWYTAPYVRRGTHSSRIYTTSMLPIGRLIFFLDWVKLYGLEQCADVCLVVYRPNYELAAPGQILRIRAARGNLTSVQTNSSEAYNILYRTTDSQYKPVRIGMRKQSSVSQDLLLASQNAEFMLISILRLLDMGGHNAFDSQQHRLQLERQVAVIPNSLRFRRPRF